MCFKNNLLIILFLLSGILSNSAYSQMALSFAATYGSGAFMLNSSETGVKTLIDPSGNVYVMGLFFDSIDFDNGPNVFYLNPGPNTSTFLLKLDSIGNFIWAGCLTNAYGRDMEFDNAGNLYITGSSNVDTDFDPGANIYTIVSSGFSFVLKLDSNNNFIWAKRFGGHAVSIAVDDSGSVVTIGDFTVNSDFDPGPGVHILSFFGSNFVDHYICKLDSSGIFQWAFPIYSPNGTSVNGISIDDSLNVYLTGSFDDICYVDTISIGDSVGYYGLYILKLSANGVMEWVKKIESNDGLVNGKKVQIDISGNICVLGEFSNFFSPVDLNPGPGVFPVLSTTGYECFVLKLNHSGDFMWASHYSRCGELWGFELDRLGNLYIIGYLTGICDLDPGPGIYNLESSGDWDDYILKLDTNGNFVWALINASGIKSEATNSICPDYNGSSIWTTGWSRSPKFDLDPSSGIAYYINPFIPSGNVFFVQKLSACNNTLYSYNLSVCDSFVAPDSIVYYSSGTYFYLMPNSSGCDSIISVNLTVNSANTTIVKTGNTLLSGSVNSQLQWVNCSNNYSVIVGQTGQTFTPTANGSYGVIVNQNGCIDTSSCFTIIISDINEEVTGNFSIFPNPTNDKIIVESISSGIYQIDIFSSDGKCLINSTYPTASRIELDTKELNNGVYFIQINHTIYKRLLISH